MNKYHPQFDSVICDFVGMLVYACCVRNIATQLPNMSIFLLKLILMINLSGLLHF